MKNVNPDNVEHYEKWLKIIAEHFNTDLDWLVNLHCILQGICDNDASGKENEFCLENLLKNSIDKQD